MHNVPTKGLLNSYRHCNQPLQKSPGSKICSFQEVFVGDSCQQPKVVLQRSELCSCYLRALANPQAASFTELKILHLRTTSSRASGQIGSSIVWTTITSMWHAFHQPWTHWLALQSHAKLQVTRQGLSFTGAIQHHNWLSSNGSTNVEQLVTLVQQRTQTDALLLYPRWWLRPLPFSQTLQCTNVPTKGLLNSYRYCNQPLQKAPGSKICSFQEVFVGDIGQQPKVVLQRSELCSCYLRALANPQAASRVSLNYWPCGIQWGGTLSPQVAAVYTVRFSHYLSMPWHVLIWACFKTRSLRTSKARARMKLQTLLRDFKMKQKHLLSIKIPRQHQSDKARLKFHWGNPTPQLTIVNGSTNVEQLVLTAPAPQQFSSARYGHRFYLSKAGIWQFPQ